MDTFEVEGGALQYQSRGEGPPLVLVAGSIFADPWEPMLSHADLLNTYQVITFRRRGYSGSSPAQPGHTLGREGSDVVALLDHLGIDQAHVVGHSLAANIVLQAVIDAPYRFLTMTLLEPGLFTVPAAAGMEKAMAGLTQVFESGDHRQAMLLFLGGAGGADLMARLKETLPADAEEMAVADAPALFQGDLPAGSSWRLDEHAARSLCQPTLLVAGSETTALYRETSAVVRGLLANVDYLELEGAGHFVHLEQAEQVANSVAAFLRRHPLR